MMNNIDFNSCKTSEVLVKSFVKKVIKILKDEIIEKNSATLLVSGGNTPKLFFQELSKVELDWSVVTVGLVDERWIDASNPDSNAYLVNKYLLQNKAKKAVFIPLFLDNEECISSEKKSSEIYQSFFDHADVLILGMGDDGHTASLFPKSSNLQEALNLERKDFCISVDPITAPYMRMSLTLKSILNAKNLFLHFQKEAKLKIYEEALKSKDIYPISQVLYNANNIKVYYSYE